MITHKQAVQHGVLSRTLVGGSSASSYLPLQAWCTRAACKLMLAIPHHRTDETHVRGRQRTLTLRPETASSSGHGAGAMICGASLRWSSAWRL